MECEDCSPKAVSADPTDTPEIPIDRARESLVKQIVEAEGDTEVNRGPELRAEAKDQTRSD